MSIINTIEIKNFKSIRHEKITGCRRINVFIGYPNVGKSNILEAIGLLTFINQKHRPIGLNGLVRFEKFTHLFNLSNIREPAYINFNDNYSLLVNYEDENGVGFTLKDINKKDPLYSFPLGSSLTVGRETLHSSQTNDIDDFTGQFPQLKKLNVKPYKFYVEKKFNKSFSALELKIPFGDNMFEVIINNAEIRKEFKELFRPYDLELLIDASMTDIKLSPPIKDGVINTMPISMVADTLIRLIFFTTAIKSNKDAVLVFEEPEAHMFPPYIRKFTSEVIFDKDNQFFIATHSPYVLETFLEDAKDDLSIYLVDYREGETKIRLMDQKELNEVKEYGVDLFFNLESYLKNGQVNNA